jgi:endoglucanase
VRPQNQHWISTCPLWGGLLALLFAVGCANGSGSSNGSGGRGGGGASGGANGSGGATGTGGKGEGGRSGTGGTGKGGSGGRSTTGGTTGSGGNSAAGGAIGTGGKATGGGSGTGGRVGSGGSASGGTGGPTGGSASGGSSGTGGVTSAGGSTGSTACVATAVVAAMKLGWNIGNSLDSVDAGKSDTTVETAWGNPVITADLVKAAAAAGFGAVRIPVTWIGRIGAAPDYPVSATFISRVEQVVKYALDQNLYVIINTHHDGDNGVAGRWITLVDSSGQATTANTEQVKGEFKKVWTQIADHFKNYGDHLIFESMNEVMVDYGTPKPEYYDGINGLNQAFVDTVRATGGYNTNRCLVVPGYNTNIDYTVAGFVAPKDTSAGKLILSDHYYDPYSFTGSAETHAWGTGKPGIDNWGQEDWVQSQVAKLKASYIDKGLPVIWGEYGAANQSGYENYRRYYMEYVTKATHDAGIVPFVWDNGSSGSGSDAFGFIKRSDNTIMYPAILEAMIRAVTSSYTLADVAKP